MKQKVTALLSVLCLVGSAAAQDIPDFTDGCLIVNEDWFGHNNSTVNHLSSDGTFTYRIIQAVNGSDIQLGCTAPIGVIYGDRFYVTSKQPKDGGADVTGGRLSVFHWPSLKILNKFEELPGGGDGRSFVGVNEHKGYVSTSNGICVLNLDNMAFEKVIEGTENPNTDDYGRLYYGQASERPQPIMGGMDARRPLRQRTEQCDILDRHRVLSKQPDLQIRHRHRRDGAFPRLQLRRLANLRGQLQGGPRV